MIYKIFLSAILLNIYIIIKAGTNYLEYESGSSGATSITLVDKYVFTKTSGDWSNLVLSNFVVHKISDDDLTHNSLCVNSVSVTSDNSNITIGQSDSSDNFNNDLLNLTITLPANFTNSTFTISLTYSLSTSVTISEGFYPSDEFTSTDGLLSSVPQGIIC
jgi:hypothetical protein